MDVVRLLPGRPAKAPRDGRPVLMLTMRQVLLQRVRIRAIVLHQPIEAGARVFLEHPRGQQHENSAVGPGLKRRSTGGWRQQIALSRTSGRLEHHVDVSRDLVPSRVERHVAGRIRQHLGFEQLRQTRSYG